MPKAFADLNDLAQRVPDMHKETLDYIKFNDGLPYELVSRAVMKDTGMTRTVRLLFRPEERTQILLLDPLVVKKVMEAKFDRWRFE